MPYIKKSEREKFTKLRDYLWSSIDNAGELNYIITKICHDYMNFHGENYQKYDDVVGSLECAKLEFYRRKVAAYEDKKIKENGDV